MFLYVHKIREEKFGGCKKSFSWLSQKVNKKIDESCMATMLVTLAQTCPWDDTTHRQDTSTPFSILIEFEATEYLYSIYIRNFEDI